jgi:hypothetical protein
MEMNMTKRGRPPKAPQDLQNVKLTARLTEAEKARLDRARGGLSFSAWVRQHLPVDSP